MSKRNAACPCGSGKKFKRCCQSKREPLTAAQQWRLITEEWERRAKERAAPEPGILVHKTVTEVSK